MNPTMTSVQHSNRPSTQRSIQQDDNQ